MTCWSVIYWTIIYITTCVSFFCVIQAKGQHFCKILLEENQKNPIPFKYMNYLSLHFGVISYLCHDSQAAIGFFDQALESSSVET